MAIAAANRLIDYDLERASGQNNENKPKHDWKKKSQQFHKKTDGKDYYRKGDSDASNQGRNSHQRKPPLRCFSCDGLHHARKCSKDSTSLLAQEPSVEETEPMETTLSPIQLLNASRTEGYDLKLGSKVQQCLSRIKAVNSCAQPI